MTFCKPDVLKPDVLKPDVLKPDVLKPDDLWVNRDSGGGRMEEGGIKVVWEDGEWRREAWK